VERIVLRLTAHTKKKEEVAQSVGEAQARNPMGGKVIKARGYQTVNEMKQGETYCAKERKHRESRRDW